MITNELIILIGILGTAILAIFFLVILFYSKQEGLKTISLGSIRGDQKNKPAHNNICKYVSPDGSFECYEQALQGEKHCILHIDFPKDDKEFERIADMKNKKVAEKIGNDDFCFIGAKLGRIVFRNLQIRATEIAFDYANLGDVWFENVHAILTIGVTFDNAIINGLVIFDKKTNIDGEIRFDKAWVGIASFQEAKMMFVSFEEARICQIEFSPDTYIAGLSFRGAEFGCPEFQEEACKVAKNISESQGNREEADYYHYREMEAKRKQKHRFWSFLELPVQYCFGYGVYPSRVFITWFAFILVFASVYWLGNGIEETNSLLECIYFSLLTATTSAYGSFHPASPYQAVVGLESILGIFMWATLIATFARKYMR
jgi:hypothetical protein